MINMFKRYPTLYSLSVVACLCLGIVLGELIGFRVVIIIMFFVVEIIFMFAGIHRFFKSYGDLPIELQLANAQEAVIAMLVAGTMAVVLHFISIAWRLN